MSQTIFADIDASATSGTQLAGYLNDFKAAIISGFSGTSRPAELLAGGMWVDTTNAGSDSWDVKIYDGTDDIIVFTIDLLNNSISVTGSSSSFAVTKTSADTVGALLTLQKERIATNGQVLDGDTIGEIRFASTDNAGGSEITCRIKAVATDDVTVSASGSYLVFEATQDTEGAIEEMMRLIDGKLGLGVTAPEANIHSKGSTGIKHEIESDDTTGAIIAMEKKRLTGDGGVESGDDIGQLTFRSKSNDTNVTEVAKWEAVAIEDHTATEKGVAFSGFSTDEGAASATEKIRLAAVSQLFKPWVIDAPRMGIQTIATTASTTALSANKHLTYFTGSTEMNIQGIAPTQDARTLLLHNGSTADIILNHEHASATSANRLHLPDDTDIVIGPDSSVEVFYSDTDSKWKLKSGSGTGGGASGGGSKNYFDSVSRVAEKSIGNWETDDGLGSVATTLTLSVETSAPLAGDGSLKITKSAADGQGEFSKLASQTLDLTDRGKVLYGSFSYDFSDSDYASGDVGVRFWDLTNDAELYAGPSDDLEILNSKGRFNYAVHTETTTEEIQIQLVVLSTSALGYDLLFDELAGGPAVQVSSVYRKSQTIDLTGSGDFTAGTLYAERVGNIVTLTMKDVAFPSDTTPDSGATVLPEWARPIIDFANNVYLTDVNGTYRVFAASTGYVGFRPQNNSGTALAGTGADFVTISYVGADVSAPTVNNNELSLQTIRASGEDNGGTGLTALSTDIDWTETKDTHSCWNGTQFTSPKTMEYTFEGMAYTSASLALTIYAYIDTVQDRAAGYDASAGFVHPIKWTGILQKGEVLSFRSSGAATLLSSTIFHWISIKSDPDYNVLGVVKQNSSQLVALASNYSNTSDGTIADITGMSLTLQPGKYLLRYDGSARVQKLTATGGGYGQVFITDSANTYLEGSACMLGSSSMGASESVYGNLSGQALVTITEETTYKLRNETTDAGSSGSITFYALASGYGFFTNDDGSFTFSATLA